MRRITACLLSLMLLAALTLSASAATAGTFLSKEYDVSEDAVYCYGKQLPPDGTLTVSSGSTKVEDAVFSTLKQEQIPVTVYCLVDISSSLPESVMQQQEDFLLTISSHMESRDNMILGQLDNVLTESKLMSDKDIRDTAIETIQRQNWYTNLYAGISQAVESVSTNTTYHTNSCLIILSDGHDDGKTNVTGEQVLKKIQESGIPVYSVVLGPANSGVTQKEVDYQEQFAEESLGGFLCRPTVEGISSAAAAERIWDSIKGASAIRIALEEFRGVQEDQELLIRYEVGQTRYEDTICIRAVDVVVPVAETQPTEENQEQTEETEAQEDEEETSGTVLWIAAGSAVVLIAAGILIAVVRKRKKAQASQTNDSADNSMNIDPYHTDVVPGPDFDAVPYSAPAPYSETASETVTDYAGMTTPVTGDCHVYAVAIMHPEIHADFWLMSKEETTFGRNTQASIVLCERDKKLSSVHGSFLWDGKMLLVRDRKSTNGTAVNGEPCTGEVWLRLEEGDVLRAGAYEYRISFRPKEMGEL